MSRVWSGVSLALAVLAAIGYLLLSKSLTQRPSVQPAVPHPVTSAPDAPSQNPMSNLLTAARSFGVRKVAADLTTEEKAALAKKFAAEIKPAVDKWSKAYCGHLPFKPEDLTLDKFREEIRRNAAFGIYTFMVDGVTFCVRDSGGRVVVNYLSAPQMRQLSQLPGPGGSAPITQMPVSREEVLRMVKDESGTAFKAHEVRLKPTGFSCAMNGGAFVDIAPLGGDPNNGLSKLALVFGPGGDIIYYDRDPTF